MKLGQLFWEEVETTATAEDESATAATAEDNSATAGDNTATADATGANTATAGANTAAAGDNTATAGDNTATAEAEVVDEPLPQPEEPTFAERIAEQNREIDDLIDELSVNPSNITEHSIDKQAAIKADLETDIIAPNRRVIATPSAPSHGKKPTKKNKTNAGNKTVPIQSTAKPEKATAVGTAQGLTVDDTFINSPEEVKKSSNKVLKNTLVVLFVMLNVGIIAYTAYKDFSKPRPEGSGMSFGLLSVGCLVGCLLCLGVVLMMETIKYMMMMQSLGQKISFKHAFEVSALGKYYDSITPSGAGGQPFQIFYLHQNKYDNGSDVAMPLTGFLTMQSGFIVLALLVFIFKNDAIDMAPALKVSAYFGIVFYLAVPLLIVLFCIFPNGISRLVKAVIGLGGRMRIIKDVDKTTSKAIKSLTDYRVAILGIAKERWLMVKLMFCSVVFQIALCSLPYFVIHAFGGNVGFIQSLAMTVFVYAAITYIPTPGNAGAAEISFNIIFEQYVPNGMLWAMLVWRFFCYYSFIILGAGIYGYNALTRKRKEK